MRISDWSSDVCSSDLHALQQGVETSLGFKARSEPATLNPWQQLLRDAARAIHAIPGAVHQHRIAGDRAEHDRKGGVWGKSGSVRVDHGVRRNMKKTIKKISKMSKIT